MNMRKALTIVLAAGMVLAISGAARADYMDVVLDDNPIVYYTFDDGTATDQSTGGHDGTVIGATPILDGVSGGALDFTQDVVTTVIDVPARG